MWKPKTLDPGKPLYLAVADALESDVAEGVLEPGERLPSQRDLSRVIGVDLSTITRALKECERRGLVSGTVGRGTFVSADRKVDVALAGGGDRGLLELGLVLPLYEYEKHAVEEACGRIVSGGGLGRFLRYSEPAGLPEHREAGAAWIGRFGFEVSPENVVVTSGAQNALACCLLALFKAGDRVAVDAMTYPGVKTAASLLGLRLVPIAMDRDGMLPEALENVCRRDAVRGLYLMPGFHNPTTASLSEERRERIAATAKRRGLLLIEDDPYVLASGSGPPPVSSLVPENAFYIGGISKVFGAGLRVAFLAVPRKYGGLLEKAVLGAVWMASPLNAAVAAGVISGGSLPGILRAGRREARLREAAALKVLPPARVTARPGGYFLWLELPGRWTGREFELAAREAGVRVFCAEKFLVGGGPAPRGVRISLTGPESRDDLARGLRILADILSRGPSGTASIL